MYELLLTALVEESDLQPACAVLGGLCGMPPWESITRVLHFQSPARPVGLPNHSSLDRPLRKDTLFLLKELHQNLTRQPYLLQIRHEILKDRDMGPSTTPMDLNATPAMLRWTDFPDPPQGRPNITQRKKVELWEQKNLLSLLSDNNYIFKTEVVEETRRFYRDDIEFCLTRQLFMRPIDDYVPMLSRTTLPSPPLEQLPSFDALTPVDAQGRWILHIKAHVLHDNKPDELRKAQDQLNGVRAELEGVFDFKVIDRKIHDTRLPQQQQGVQVLPQKVTLGKA